MIIDKIEEVKNSLEETLLKEDMCTNISKTERVLSMASGSYIFLKGISNIFSSPIWAGAELYLGFNLIQRGVTGHCSLAQNINGCSAEPSTIVGVEEEIIP